jgi:precorrin-3B C17-methyltransferase
MAALAFAVLAARNWDGSRPEVAVIPGVTAATAAAALLGAPLGQDFAAISLSDLNTPWPVIRRRLEAAAAADLVLALYNPRSGRRPGHLAEAARILLRHRPPDTPVGIVRAAYRPDQEVRIAELGQLASAPADMVTTVVVGSSRTRVVAGRLFTPSRQVEGDAGARGRLAAGGAPAGPAGAEGGEGAR